MAKYTIDHVLDLLHNHHQRATYGALAELVGGHARSVLQGRTRDWRHSWVVNQDSGMPTEYPAGKVHPKIAEHAEILETAEELEDWLDRHAEAS